MALLKALFSSPSTLIRGGKQDIPERALWVCARFLKNPKSRKWRDQEPVDLGTGMGGRGTPSSSGMSGKFLIHKTEAMKASLSHLRKHLSNQNIYHGSFPCASS